VLQEEEAIDASSCLMLASPISIPQFHSSYGFLYMHAEVTAYMFYLGVRRRAGNGSMGHGSWVKWVTKIGWVTWVMGH